MNSRNPNHYVSFQALTKVGVIQLQVSQWHEPVKGYWKSIIITSHSVCAAEISRAAMNNCKGNAEGKLCISCKSTRS